MDPTSWSAKVSTPSNAARSGPIRTLTLTSLFPNDAQPRHGIFTQHRIKHLIATNRVCTTVIAPVPWAPRALRRLSRYRPYTDVAKHGRRHDIDIYYPRYVSIPRIGMNVAPFLYALTAFLSLLRKPFRRQIDVIDSYYIFPDGIAAALLGKLLNKPVILTAYGSDVNVIPSYYLPRQMIRWACGQADAVTTVCEALKESLVAVGVDPRKVHVIRHGVDLQLFKPSGRREALRQRFGFNRRTLLTVGHLIELKGHHIVIEALEHLPDTDVVIVGHGPMEQELEDLARRRGLEDRVRLLGHVSQEHLPAYYEAADALVLASSREGIANVLVEALACGTPVVTTRVGGAAEVITSPVAGRLVSARTPEAVAEALDDLFQHMPQRGHTRHFAERFTWTDTARQHLALLDDVLSRRTQANTRR